MNRSDLWCTRIGFFFDGICRGDLFFSYPRLSIVIFCCLLFSFNGSKVESRCRSLFEIKCSHPGALFTELLSKSSHYPSHIYFRGSGRDRVYSSPHNFYKESEEKELGSFVYNFYLSGVSLILKVYDLPRGMKKVI